MKAKAWPILSKVAKSLNLSKMIQRSGHMLFMPFYHSVKANQALPHIKHLYRVRPIEQFERDLDYLITHFQPIDLATLTKHIIEQIPFQKPVFFLSFDDGLKEVYEHAFPLLKKKGIPATVFLNSAFVDNHDLFFRYKASLLFEKITQKEITKATLQKCLTILKQPASLTQGILAINYENRNKLDELANVLDLGFDNFLKEFQPYLTTDQIMELSTNDFTFGGHSIDHPNFRDLPTSEQLRQCKISVEKASLFNPQLPCFAFPFSDQGVDSHFFKTVNEQKITQLTFGISGISKDKIATHLQRFPIEKYPEEAREIIPTAYLYYLSKALLGKGWAQR